MIKKDFESKMMEMLTEVVSSCYDNVKDLNNVEFILIMLWNEENAYQMEYDYIIDGKLVIRNLASDYAGKMCSITMDEGNQTTRDLGKHFKENGQPQPTIYKIIFDAKTTTMKLNIEYRKYEEETGELITFYYKEWVKDCMIELVK